MKAQQKKVKKEDFVNALQQGGMDSESARLFVKAVISCACEQISLGHDVSILNIGSFMLVDRKKKVRQSFRADDQGDLRRVIIRRPAFLPTTALVNFAKRIKQKRSPFCRDLAVTEGEYASLSDFCVNQAFRQRLNNGKDHTLPCEYAFEQLLIMETALEPSECIAALSLFGDYFAECLRDGKIIAFKMFGTFDLYERRTKKKVDGVNCYAKSIRFRPSKKLVQVIEVD